MLVIAVDAIPDIFKTLANITADFTAATIVARFQPASEPAPLTAQPDGGFPLSCGGPSESPSPGTPET